MCWSSNCSARYQNKSSTISLNLPSKKKWFPVIFSFSLLQKGLLLERESVESLEQVLPKADQHARHRALDQEHQCG